MVPPTPAAPRGMPLNQMPPTANTTPPAAMGRPSNFHMLVAQLSEVFPMVSIDDIETALLGADSQVEAATEHLLTRVSLMGDGSTSEGDSSTHPPDASASAAVSGRDESVTVAPVTGSSTPQTASDQSEREKEREKEKDASRTATPSRVTVHAENSMAERKQLLLEAARQRFHERQHLKGAAAASSPPSVGNTSSRESNTPSAVSGNSPQLSLQEMRERRLRALTPQSQH